jgi:nicotinamidase-related amidase
MSAAKSFRELAGVVPSTASPSDSTLIIIDAQNEYAEGQLKTENIGSTRKAILDLLNIYRQAGSASQIVHVVHQSPEGAPFFTPGTTLAEEFVELKPQEGEHFIKKEEPGSFTGTNLDDILKKSNHKKVVLTGYMAHVCVSTTARQAAERGYDVILAKEAIGDRNIPGAKAQEVVEGSLRELSDAFATVVSVNDVK